MENVTKQLPTDTADWDAIKPIGGEFGSADYERLAEFDHQALLAIGNAVEALRWLGQPQEELDGGIPEELANSQQGHERIMQVFQAMQSQRNS